MQQVNVFLHSYTFPVNIIPANAIYTDLLVKIDKEYVWHKLIKYVGMDGLDFFKYAASNVKNSPTKPEVPGKPIEPNVNIKKRIDNFGIFEFSPP